MERIICPVLRPHCLLWVSDETVFVKKPWKLKYMVIFMRPVVSVLTTHTNPFSSQLGSKHLFSLKGSSPGVQWVRESIVLPSFLTSWSKLKLYCPQAFSVSIKGSPSFGFSKAYLSGALFRYFVVSTFRPAFPSLAKSGSYGGRERGTFLNSSSLASELPGSPDSNFSGIISLHP